MSSNRRQVVRTIINVIDNLCDDMARADYIEVMMDIQDAILVRLLQEEPDNDD